MNAAIEVEDLVKVFPAPKRAARGVGGDSFDVESGDIRAVVPLVLAPLIFKFAQPFKRPV